MSAQLEPYLLLPNTVNYTMHVLLEKDIIPESRLNYLKDDCKEIINPCLIMDQRHKMVGRKKNEDLSLSIGKILKKEDKEKSLIEGEIRRYQRQLQKERKLLLDKSLQYRNIHRADKQKICPQGSKKTSEVTNTRAAENRCVRTLKVQPGQPTVNDDKLLCKTFSRNESNDDKLLCESFSRNECHDDKLLCKTSRNEYNHDKLLCETSRNECNDDKLFSKTLSRTECNGDKLFYKALSRNECSLGGESEFKRPHYSAEDYEEEKIESRRALKASRKCRSAESRKCVRGMAKTKACTDLKQKRINEVREYCFGNQAERSSEFIEECNEQLDRIELLEELWCLRRRVQYASHAEDRSGVYTKISHGEGVKEFAAVLPEGDVRAELTDCSVVLRKQLVIFQNASVTGVEENFVLDDSSEKGQQSRTEVNQELSSNTVFKRFNKISEKMVKGGNVKPREASIFDGQDGLEQVENKMDRTSNHSSTDMLALKYAHIWLKRARDARQVERQNKIVSFVSNLEKFVEKNNNKKSQEDKDRTKKATVNKEAREKKIYGESFKNRLEKQKEIISKQKSVLEEQKRKIRELEEKKVKKCREAENKIDKTPVNVVKRERKSIKPPVFVYNMQKRAEERQKQKERLKETQRRKEEEKQVRLIREEEEKRARQEEVKRKEIEEREMQFLRKLLREEGARREREMVRQAQERLIQLHRRELLARGLLAFKENLLRATAVCSEMDKVYTKSLLRRSFYLWRKQTAGAKLQRELLAVTYYQQKLLRKGMQALRKNRLEAVHESQVADDVHDLHLTRRAFNLWFLHHKQMKRKLQHMSTLANLFYERALVSRCFNAWKILPELLFKEREEEARIRQWEEKVQTVLSDFKIS